MIPLMKIKNVGIAMEPERTNLTKWAVVRFAEVKVRLGFGMKKRRKKMILFKKEHVQPILEGRKTQTRRTGKLRWKVGAIRQAKTAYNKDSEFAKLKILAIRQEPLGAITEADAIAEGYNSIREYRGAFKRIYGFWDGDKLVWVIDFELASIPTE